MSEQNEKLHKVIVDRSRCCGYGLCAALCPDVYKLDGDGIVYLDMKGACSGCPSSTATLKHGIQNLLRHFVPEVTEVRPV